MSSLGGGHIVSVLGKGGVGKTVITALTGIVLKEAQGLRMLLIDGEETSEGSTGLRLHKLRK
ncbi:MAG: hypothetical protein Q6352_017520 [Candidatus Freyrarchaeum guaymaensis]